MFKRQKLGRFFTGSGSYNGEEIRVLEGKKVNEVYLRDTKYFRTARLISVVERVTLCQTACLFCNADKFKEMLI
jgi:hypothetical protein